MPALGRRSEGIGIAPGRHRRVEPIALVMICHQLALVAALESWLKRAPQRRDCAMEGRISFIQLKVGPDNLFSLVLGHATPTPVEQKGKQCLRLVGAGLFATPAL